MESDTNTNLWTNKYDLAVIFHRSRGAEGTHTFRRR